MCLLDMGMVADMILTIAVITITTGAIAEFQLRVGYIRTAADGAAVGIVCFCRSSALIILAVGERNGLTGCAAVLPCPILVCPLSPPGLGQQVLHIHAKEQEVVQKADQREQRMRQKIDGIAFVEHLDGDHDQVEQRHDPCSDGNNEEDQKLCIRVGGGISQHQAQVQVVGHVGVKALEISCGDQVLSNDHIAGGAENHGKGIHQQHTGKVEEIKLQCSHTGFHIPAQHIEKIEEQKTQETAFGLGEYIAEQAPDLSLQNLTLIKAQKLIKPYSGVHQAHDDYQGIAQGNIQHQIGNALIPVLEAKTGEFSTQVFQQTQLLLPNYQLYII